MKKIGVKRSSTKKLGNTNSPSNSFLKNVYEGVLLCTQNGTSFSCRTPAAAAPLDIMRIMSGFFLYDQPQPFELLAVLRAGGHDIDAGRIYAAVP